MTDSKTSTTIDDVEAAIAYLRQHAKVKNDPPKPAEPTPLTKRADIQDVLASPAMTADEELAVINMRYAEVAKQMEPRYRVAFSEIEPYLADVYYGKFTIADVASIVQVNRATVWRWFKKIDDRLVQSRRDSVNLSEIPDERALAIFRDSVYNALSRGELAEKYDYPDKTIQALIQRGRKVHEKQLKQAHKRGVR